MITACLIVLFVWLLILTIGVIAEISTTQEVVEKNQEITRNIKRQVDWLEREITGKVNESYFDSKINSLDEDFRDISNKFYSLIKYLKLNVAYVKLFPLQPFPDIVFTKQKELKEKKK